MFAACLTRDSRRGVTYPASIRFPTRFPVVAATDQPAIVEGSTVPGRRFLGPTRQHPPTRQVSVTFLYQPGGLKEALAEAGNVAVGGTKKLGYLVNRRVVVSDSQGQGAGFVFRAGREVAEFLAACKDNPAATFAVVDDLR